MPSCITVIATMPGIRKSTPRIFFAASATNGSSLACTSCCRPPALRSMLSSTWLHHLATVDGRADMFSQFTTLFDAPELVNDALPRMLAVTPEQAVAAAADVIRPDNRLVLVYVPAEEAAA